MSNPTELHSDPSPDAAAPQAARTARDYKGRIKPIWCPGCGNYAVLNAMMHAFATLEIDPDQLAVVSGIGCSSRLPGFVKNYAFHGLHGRALPVALGVKLGNPRLTVVVVGGDGDGLSIGAGHFPHVARRNIDLTYIMFDNRIYGLTKGQTSPTTPTGQWTKTSPYGVVETPVNPLTLAVVYGATFVARAYAGQMKETQALIERGMRHKGFSLIQVLTPCVTFGKGCGFESLKTCVQPVPAEHATADAIEALRLAGNQDDIYTGVFFETERPEFVDVQHGIGAARGRELDDSAPPIDIERLIERFS